MSEYDVLTLGESMLRLSPPGMQRLEQAAAFEIHVGGSESNTAVGLARLGLRIAWLSRLGENAVGRIVAAEIARHGVDCQYVRWAAGERVGTYFVEYAPPPRGIQLLYDRADSAMSRMRPQDLPATLFEPTRGAPPAPHRHHARPERGGSGHLPPGPGLGAAGRLAHQLRCELPQQTLVSRSGARGL